MANTKRKTAGARRKEIVVPLGKTMPNHLEFSTEDMSDGTIDVSPNSSFWRNPSLGE